MAKKLAILESENTEIIAAVKNYFMNKDVEIRIINTVAEGFDLVVLTGFETSVECRRNVKILNIYPSLLPAFKGGDAIKNTFLEGVKVGGVTVHEVNKDEFYGRILAQYPVLIGNTTHIDEFKAELIAIVKTLYPVVIESVLNDKVFDFSDMFKSSCSGNCGGCGNCH